MEWWTGRTKMVHTTTIELLSVEFSTVNTGLGMPMFLETSVSVEYS